MNGFKVFGYICIAIAVVTLVGVIYINSRVGQATRTFSSYTLLSSSWEQYKKKFINQDGRVIDFTQNDITTSEGQSYALLRAVFSDDKDTFDKTWQWTKTTLKRPKDNLFGWRWGKRDDGKYGFIAGGGDNSAADADSDIALALILAQRRWQDKSYGEDAQKILDDLWLLSTDTAVGKRYLIAGNWAKNNEEMVVNPSYFAPYAWRIFAQFDTKHDWNSLLNPGYDLLSQTCKLPLDKQASVGLAPNWVSVKKANGEVRSASLSNLNTDYSFDAIRTPWRVALDYQWFKEERAKTYLTECYQFLDQQYSQQGTLAQAYTHDGTVIDATENPSMYATALGYFIVAQPQKAKQIYEDKIIQLYSNDENTFKENIPYYEQNWLWFGAALYLGKLPLIT